MQQGVDDDNRRGGRGVSLRVGLSGGEVSREDDDYFGRAADYSQRVGAKFFAARIDLSWGQMLARRRAEGDTDEARDLLDRARSSAAAHGYAVVERRAARARALLDVD